ncbi:Bsr5794 protein [hydrothermal vent metagenome]|uniref:Bsr5794 protein n=1 Tax=hydrothermal vent metagenome TaxID=652676 RepID=A0A3B0SH73_9ZZZZ
MSVAGVYDCVTKSPMGDQKSVLTLEVDGDTVTGTNAGGTGSMDVEDGKVDGNSASWTMNMTVPMPMKLEANVTVEGDTLTGTVKAGAFGEMAMTGTRQS